MSLNDDDTVNKFNSPPVVQLDNPNEMHTNKTIDSLLNAFRLIPVFCISFNKVIRMSWFSRLEQCY